MNFLCELYIYITQFNKYIMKAGSKASLKAERQRRTNNSC